MMSEEQRIEFEQFQGLIFETIANEYLPVRQGTDLPYLGYEFIDGINQPIMCKIEGGWKVFLTRASEGNMIKAIYEHSHECMHLLAPVEAIDCTYFEEGLATKFQIHFASKNPWQVDGGRPYFEVAKEGFLTGDDKYCQAYKDILDLEELSGSSINTICKTLFGHGLIRNFGDLTPEILNKVTGIPVSNGLLHRLVKKFYQ